MNNSKWKSIPRNHDTLSWFDKELSSLDQKYDNILPNLRCANTLLLGSDYSGESSDSPYKVFSFLLTSLESWANWDSARIKIREEYLSDSRRMSFKRLNDGQRKRALPFFLEAANSLNGLSLTIAINKKGNLFESSCPLDLNNPEFAAFKKWKIEILQKAFFIIHVIATMIAGLASPGQNVMWFTDEDSIAANNERVCELTSLFSWILSTYLTFDLGHLRCGNSKCDNGTMQIEDFLSIPDIIAGTIAEQMFLKTKDPFESSKFFCIQRGDFSNKSREITQWFLETNCPLKRLFFVVDPNKKGTGNTISTFHFYNQKT